MVGTAILIGLTGTHTEGGMAIKGDADRFGGAFSRATVSDGAKAVGDGAFADRAGRAIAVVFAGISNLGGAGEAKEEQKKAKGDCQEGEFLFFRSLLHGVVVSRQSVSGDKVAKLTRWKPRMVSLQGLYRRVGALTR